MLPVPQEYEQTSSGSLSVGVMGEPTEPTPSPTRASILSLDEKTLDANRTEIFILAIGILFLVSQLILIIWLFVPRAFARKPREQRTLEWRPVVTDSIAPSTILTNQGDSRPIRRSSTWNGRSAETSRNGQPVRRRKSSGLKSDETHAFLIPEHDSDASDRERSARKGLPSTGLASATPVMPAVPLSPRRMRGLLSSSKPEQNSEYSSDCVREMDLLPASFSPRSPRLGPMNLATVSAILKADERMPDPMSLTSLLTDEKDLANSFDDPLGVSHRKLLFGKDDSAPINQWPRS